MERFLSDPCCLLGILGIAVLGVGWMAKVVARGAGRVWRRGRTGRLPLEGQAGLKHPDDGVKGRL